MDINDTVTITQAAEMKSVTRQSIRNAIKADLLKVVATVAGRRLLSRADVEKYKPRQKRAAAAMPATGAGEQRREEDGTT